MCEGCALIHEQDQTGMARGVCMGGGEGDGRGGERCV